MAAPIPKVSDEMRDEAIQALTDAFDNQRIEKVTNPLVIDGRHFDKLGVLGKGGFGKVYKCERRSGKIVALKEVPIGKAKLDEAEVMKKLRGPDYIPYFVQCYDVFQNSSAIYMEMEYCSGGTLEKMMKSYPKGLPLDQILSNIFHLIEGVRKLHALDLMHRDLKPSNILVAELKNGAKQLKIADFGLTKATPAGGSIYHQTQCPNSCYRAPEFVEGHRYDKSVDVYSLGAICYFMSRGQHPRLEFDRCGYPSKPGLWWSIVYPNYGHLSLMDRMMCKRPEERQKLENLDFHLTRGTGDVHWASGCRLLDEGTVNCAVCGLDMSKVYLNHSCV